jgi:nucleoside-diphosphate-sugar epimerase
MKIQIFGGKGFVGSAFIKKCGEKKNLCVINERNDYTVKSCDIIYMISTVSNYNVLQDPYLDINTNLITLIKVLEQCKNKENVIFNFISSWFVYGETEIPAYENTYCKPNGFYSITKRCAEQLIISFCKTFNIKYRILRLANVAGYGDKKASPQKNAFQFMINEMKLGNNVNVYDNGDFYRDYIHVDDIAEAIYLIMNKGEINDIYNVGNGNPLLFKDMIDYAKSKIVSKSKLISVATPEFHKTVQVKSMWMNSDKLHALGYKPKYKMEHMIDDMIR